jgi:hypothetical protein
VEVAPTEPPQDRDPGEIGGLKRDQFEKYKKLRRMVDNDAVQDLLERHGPKILDRSFPYLVVAARNRLRDRSRRGASRFETSTALLPDVGEKSQTWDPLTKVIGQENLQRLVAALSDMDDRDVLVVWRNVEGVPYSEIRSEWDARGFQPPSPSVQTLRKRNERALSKLRLQLADLRE